MPHSRPLLPPSPAAPVACCPLACSPRRPAAVLGPAAHLACFPLSCCSPLLLPTLSCSSSPLACPPPTPPTAPGLLLSLLACFPSRPLLLSCSPLAWSPPPPLFCWSCALSSCPLACSPPCLLPPSLAVLLACFFPRLLPPSSTAFPLPAAILARRSPCLLLSPCLTPLPAPLACSHCLLLSPCFLPPPCMLRPLPGPQLSLLSSVPTDWSLVNQIQFDTPVSQYLQDHVMMHSGGEVKVGRARAKKGAEG